MKALRQVLGTVAALGLLALAGCELFLPEGSKECEDFCSNYFDVTCAKQPSWISEICPSFCTIVDDEKEFAKRRAAKDCALNDVLFTGDTTDFCKVIHNVCGDKAACENSDNDSLQCRTKWLELALYSKRKGGCSAEVTKACGLASGLKCTGTPDPSACK